MNLARNFQDPFYYNTYIIVVSVSALMLPMPLLTNLSGQKAVVFVCKSSLLVQI